MERVGFLKAPSWSQEVLNFLFTKIMQFCNTIQTNIVTSALKFPVRHTAKYQPLHPGCSALAVRNPVLALQLFPRHSVTWSVLKECFLRTLCIPFQCGYNAILALLLNSSKALKCHFSPVLPQDMSPICQEGRSCFLRGRSKSWRSTRASTNPSHRRHRFLLLWQQEFALAAFLAPHTPELFWKHQGPNPASAHAAGICGEGECCPAENAFLWLSTWQLGAKPSWKILKEAKRDSLW